jgi:hypothetical protein
MQWVDQETYVGPCRRVTQRAFLLQRRRRNCARPSPPDPRVLLNQIAHDLELEEGAPMRARAMLRLAAGLDLADRLGDRPMKEAFRALSRRVSAHAQRR